MTADMLEALATAQRRLATAKDLGECAISLTPDPIDQAAALVMAAASILDVHVGQPNAAGALAILTDAAIRDVIGAGSNLNNNSKGI